MKLIPTNQNFRTSRNRGSALLLTVVIIGVIALTLFAYLTWSETQTKLEMRSQLWNAAMPVAEAGIEEAMAHLNSTNDFGANGWTLSLGSGYTKQRAFGEGYYQVLIKTNQDNLGATLLFAADTVATAILSSGFVRVPPGDTYISRTVTVKCRRQDLMSTTLLAKSGISFSTNSVVDSFDSQMGKYDPLTRGDRATLGCGGVVDIGAAHVFGKATIYPNGSVAIDGSGSLGDMAWQMAGNTGIQAGAISTNGLTFRSNSPPTGAFFTPSGGDVGGTNYTYVLGSGSYQTTQFSVGGGGAAIVTGKAELYVTGDFNIAGSGYLWITPGASLKIYVDGQFACGGGGIVNGTGIAANLSVLGLNECGVCTYDSSSEFFGTINAPNAAVTVNTSADIYGAITGSTITVSGGGGVHYDQALSNSGRRYVVDSWDEWVEF